MQQQNQTVELKILGQKIVLKSGEQYQPEFVSEVIELVSKKLQEAEQRTKGLAAAHYVAVLALMDLAEDYLKAKKLVSEHQQAILAKSEELSQLLNPN
jgi:cell division protein ZapA (FtsZ GTPase activity inhibitor)